MVTWRQHIGIKYELCSQAGISCQRESEIMVVFKQELRRSTSTNPARKTNINWLVNMQGDSSSYNLLASGPFDYVAQWNPRQQKNFGTAYSRYTNATSNITEMTVTGEFQVVQGMPYFVSAMTEKDIYWTGKMPKHVTFELKYVPGTFSENYIVLPLDTQIKTAKDLCNKLITKGIMNGSSTITRWDALQQLPVILPKCQLNPNISLEPGVPYLIRVTNSGNWVQE
ncbi:MAG: hypothetical protein AB1393_08355 [Candidatus Edwardsbacteria bacterium]